MEVKRVAEKIFEVIDCSEKLEGLYTRENEHRGIFTIRWLAGLILCTGSDGTFVMVYKEELRAPGHFEFSIIEAFSGVILVELGQYDIHTIAKWKKHRKISLESVVAGDIVQVLPTLRKVDIEYYHKQFRINNQFLTKWKGYWNVKF